MNNQGFGPSPQPGFFFAVVVVLGVLAVLLAAPPALEDPFDNATRDPVTLDHLPAEELGGLKLAHLSTHAAYEIVLFGNSRSLPVGGSDLGFADGQFFNASISGQSFRSNLLFLENLAKIGKAPRLAIFSFDNAELQYYGNPYWPPLPMRWHGMAMDIVSGVRRADVSWADLAKMVRRHFVVEANIISQRLSFERVWRGLKTVGLLLTGTPANYPRAAQGWHRDGSRVVEAIGPAYVPAPIAQANRNVLPGYLRMDFERLAGLSASGTRIIVFETFLHPGLTRQWLAQPSSPAVETRTELVRLCAQHRIECHLSPGVVDDGGLPWADADHPPQPVIAAHIRSILDAEGGR